MDVELPDGTIIRGVPEGITKAELTERLKRNGYDVSALGQAAQPTATQSDILDRASRAGSALKRAVQAPGAAIYNTMQRANQPVYTGMASILDRLGRPGDAAYTRDVQAKDRAGGSAEQMVGNVGGDVLTGLAMAGGAGGAIGAGGRALARVPGMTGAGSVLQGLGQATMTAGGRTGFSPATTAQGFGNTMLRSAGGAIAGGAGAAATDIDNAGIAATIGAAVPVVGAVSSAAGRAAGNAVRPFTDGGRKEIARRVLAESVADPAAIGRISSPPKSVAQLTTAEAALDPGISSLQRTMVNANKGFSDDLAIRQAQQNSARFDALYGMSAGDNSPEALIAARKAATDPLLEAARLNAGEVGTMGVRAAAKDVASSPAFQRKAVRSAVKEAVEPFSMATDDGAKAWARKVDFDTAWGARQNIDDISRGASNKVNDRAAKAAGAQLTLLRERLSTALEKASPEFKTYSSEYARRSNPVDAARTLQEMLKQATTGTADMMGNPVMSGAKLTQALKAIKPADWARFSEAQRESVQSLAVELQAAATAQTLGRSVGSNTIQNAIAAENMPLAVRAASSWLPGGGLLSPVIDMALRGPSQKVQGLLGEALLDPAAASQLLSLSPAMQAQMNPALRQALYRSLPMAPGSLLSPVQPAMSESRR